MVEAKFKQTDIGQIPEDWEIIGLQNNITLKARIGWQGLTTAEYRESGDYYLITGTDFKNGYIDWKNCVFVDKIRYEQDRNIQVKVKDILVTKDGTIGKVAYIDSISKPTTLNSGVFVLRASNEKLDSRFIYYILMSFYFENFLKQITAGSTITHLYQKDFVHFNFVVPPLPEQHAIAEALSDTDHWITKLEDLIAKKQLIKQGAMQKLLTPKDDWKVKKLGEMSQIYTGNKNNQDKIEDGLYPFFVRSQKVEKINSYSYDGEAILIPGEGNLGSIFHYINGKFDFHQRVYKVSNFKNINGKFLYWYFRMHFGQHALQNTVKATVDSIRLPTLQEFEVLFPLIEKQIEIAIILSDMDAEIETLNQKLVKAKQVKQGLMQELLTGRIRLV